MMAVVNETADEIDLADYGLGEEYNWIYVED
jgi:hypothetical protein